MWSKYMESFQTAMEAINNSLTECPAWPVLKHPFFVLILSALLFVLMLRRMYKAVVALISGLVLIVICQSTLTNVVVPDCFGNKLPIFVVGFLIVAGVNVYFLLIRD